MKNKVIIIGSLAFVILAVGVLSLKNNNKEAEVVEQEVITEEVAVEGESEATQNTAEEADAIANENKVIVEEVKEVEVK